MRAMRRIVLALLLLATPLLAQQPPPYPTYDRELEATTKQIDDVMWHLKLGDAANIDKVELTSKPGRDDNPTGQGAGNPMIIPAYVFTPKTLRGKAPLIVFVHGGVHADMDSSYAHIIRELLDQGYVIVAPEYRGSTGYGGYFYDQIDYGGAEVDDVKAARDWAVENLTTIDTKRIGILGWSHGGYQTLMNIFRWPDAYQVAYAGVPVSDLVQRMGYKGQGYRNTFKDFIGKEAKDDPMEYRRRSPYFHADKLATPLLIHTNTNDEDVNVMEVEHLIDALKANGKKFEYKIYQAAPGGHRFNRIDTKLAKESRQEVYAFLAKYLK
ncbi:MAG: S9 family peptidase [Acidobacteria bacterium]|nr:S9 family peptidase [Acidobacteriota bacterium]